MCTKLVLMSTQFRVVVCWCVDPAGLVLHLFSSHLWWLSAASFKFVSLFCNALRCLFVVASWIFCLFDRFRVGVWVWCLCLSWFVLRLVGCLVGFGTRFGDGSCREAIRVAMQARTAAERCSAGALSITALSMCHISVTRDPIRIDVAHLQNVDQH